MVAIQRQPNKLACRLNALNRIILCTLVVIVILYVVVFAKDEPPNSGYQCPYMSLSHLTDSELHPQKGSRHMINPPGDGRLTLVCCETTAGPWNILTHHNWAPLGAAAFVDMVQDGYFSATVPLFRCLENFLCQFGLTGEPEVTHKYKATFPDDPNWLPEGPTNRQNEGGVIRYAKGYLAYAGAGPNTRSNQFIVSNAPSKQLAGGSPWEVPWGELVGQHSFDALDKFYTGYGDKGPSQGELHAKGVTDELRQRFPKLDYIASCTVVDERGLKNV